MMCYVLRVLCFPASGEADAIICLKPKEAIEQELRVTVSRFIL